MKLKVNKIRIFIKNFSMILFVVVLVSFIMMFIIEHNISSVKAQEIKNEEKLFLIIEKEVLKEVFDTIISDLEYLRDTYDEDNNHLNDYWRIFSGKNKVYKQLRFIDIDGNEKIKVNYDKGIPLIIPDIHLKNRKNDSYFTQTSILKDGQIFVSYLDLNMEKGKVFRASNPIMIFSMPVYHNNELKGIIVLNYNAKYMLDKIQDISINSNGKVYLLDEKGYWLYSDDPKDKWGFMYEESKDITFANRFPHEWNSMGRFGVIVSKNGLFTYTDVDIKRYGLSGSLSDHEIFFSNGKWRLVSYINASSEKGYYVTKDFIAIIKHIVKYNYYYFLYMVILAFIITLLILQNKISMLKIKYIYEYDSMTNVYNRRAGFLRLGKCIANIINNKNIALCYIDVNGLKEINDKFGHHMGDELLITVVENIKENIRENDFIIRLGGDEFLVVLPKLNQEEAENVWLRIVQSFHNINVTETREYFISVSHGMAEINSLINKDTLEKLITQADDKMYEEKRVIKQNIKIIR